MCLTARWACLPAVALVLITVSTVQAVMITNVTSGTQLFLDNFEGANAIGAGFVDDPGTTNYAPTAITGSWSITESDARQIQVTDFSGTTTTSVDYPGAFQGDNCMWFNRTGGFNAAFARPTSLQNTNGDAIHYEWMAYLRDFDSGRPGVFSLYHNINGSGDRIVGLVAESDGSIDGGGSLAYTSDTWQRWAVDYVVGANTYDLTIDGIRQTGLAVKDSAGAAGTVRFGSSAGVEYFVDAVPEPSALVLIVMGLFGLAVCRRRKRR